MIFQYKKVSNKIIKVLFRKLSSIRKSAKHVFILITSLQHLLQTFFTHIFRIRVAARGIIKL